MALPESAVAIQDDWTYILWMFFLPAPNEVICASLPTLAEEISKLSALPRLKLSASEDQFL